MKIWQWEEGDGNKNFGDWLTQPIIRTLYGVEPRSAPLGEAELVGAGSILELLYNGAPQNLIVWGSGFIKKGPNHGPIFDFRLVRGELTRNRLGIKVPVGDPGLLADSLVSGWVPKEFDIGVFPHYVDRNNELVREWREDDRICVFDAYSPVEETLAQMARCGIIYSSSLHGMIAADSLGIPNARIKLSDKLTGGDYKFLDYLSAFNIEGDQITQVTPRWVTEEATEDMIRSEYSRPGLSAIRENIYDSFPIEFRT